MSVPSTECLLPSPKEAARLLDGDLLPGDRILCPGPYHSKADRSLSVRFGSDAPDGFVVHSFAGDDPLACRDYVREILGLPEFGRRRPMTPADHAAIARKRAEAKAQQVAHAESRREKARWLWSISRPILGSPAARYLRERRIGVLPETLRYLSARGSYPPALIAAYGLPTEPEPGRYSSLPANAVDAVHITRLLPDGSDRERQPSAKVMVASPGTMPIALIPPNDLGGLVVAEGVETALSYAHLGFGCWAAGSKDRLVTIAPAIAALPCIEVVTISPDEDDPARVGVGMTSRDRAEQLAEALHDLRPDIEVRIA